jgi:hypothetical protein
MYDSWCRRNIGRDGEGMGGCSGLIPSLESECCDSGSLAKRVREQFDKLLRTVEVCEQLLDHPKVKGGVGGPGEDGRSQGECGAANDPIARETPKERHVLEPMFIGRSRMKLRWRDNILRYATARHLG